jgi:antitoxin ParD1/3/4
MFRMPPLSVRDRGGNVKLITIHLPESYINDLDELVDGNFYPNRAEAIRLAVRDMLVAELWERKKRFVGAM